MFYLEKFGYKVLLESQVEVSKTLGGKPNINYYAKNAPSKRDFYLSKVEEYYGIFYYFIQIKDFEIVLSINSWKQTRPGISVNPKHNLPTEKAKKSLASFFKSIGFKTYLCNSRLSELLLESEDNGATALYSYHFMANRGGYATSLSEKQVDTLLKKCYTLNSDGSKVKVKKVKSKAVA